MHEYVIFEPTQFFKWWKFLCCASFFCFFFNIELPVYRDAESQFERLERWYTIKVEFSRNVVLNRIMDQSSENE